MTASRSRSGLICLSSWVIGRFALFLSSALYCASSNVCATVFLVSVCGSSHYQDTVESAQGVAKLDLQDTSSVRVPPALHSLG